MQAARTLTRRCAARSDVNGVESTRVCVRVCSCVRRVRGRAPDKPELPLHVPSSGDLLEPRTDRELKCSVEQVVNGGRRAGASWEGPEPLMVRRF